MDIKPILNKIKTSYIIGKPKNFFRLCSPKNLRKDYLAYVVNEQYLSQVKDVNAVLLVPKSLLNSLPKGYKKITFLIVPNVFIALDIIQRQLYLLDNMRKLYSPDEAKRTNNKIGKSVIFGHNVRLGIDSTIGAGCIIRDNVVIGEKVTIGKNTIVMPNVAIYDYSRIGSNVLLHAGCVIGQDGFRFEKTGDKMIKVFHVGNVVIGDNVEIGANCTIARGTYDSTILNSGVKLDSQVHVGHNAQIGQNSTLAAQTCIAGSVIIGKECWIGAGVTISHGVKIANGSKILLNAVVAYDINEPDLYSGFYAMTHRKWKQHMKDIQKKGSE
jgi:UDP-3-O-[3-hydroxymyristoyl] glucosamine N-acyltransferase